MSPQDTFARAKNWVKELQRQASPNIVIALAGNKADLASKRAVEFQVGAWRGLAGTSKPAPLGFPQAARGLGKAHDSRQPGSFYLLSLAVGYVCMWIAEASACFFCKLLNETH